MTAIHVPHSCKSVFDCRIYNATCSTGVEHVVFSCIHLGISPSQVLQELSYFDSNLIEEFLIWNVVNKQRQHFQTLTFMFPEEKSEKIGCHKCHYLKNGH